MNKDKLVVILGIVGSVATIIGVAIQWQSSEESWQRTLSDWEIMDKGEKIRDEYSETTFAYWDEKISESEYVEKLKELVPKYQDHLDEVDSRIWEEDAISHRKMISQELDLIKKKIDGSVER